MFSPNYKRLLTIAFFVLQSTLTAQGWSLGELISDTLTVQLVDSGSVAPAQASHVLDHRVKGGNYLGIRQIKKYIYIPVDQYILADYPLADCLEDSITLASGHNLVIDYLDIWHKGGWRLNGYTYETDSAGQKIRDWQWGVSIKKVKKEPVEESIARLTKSWITDQKQALDRNTDAQLSPRRYRRQMVFWADMVMLSDGSYIIDGRLSLPYPNDQKKIYKASIPGMYYRKGRYHESIAIGGGDSQRYTRLSDSWVLRQNSSFRVGLNSFDGEHFNYVPWWNLFMFNIGLTASIEYRPPYLKGFFWGAGLHATYNILPEVVTQGAGGLLISAGVMLP